MPVPIDPDSFGFLIGDLSRLLRAETERRIGATGLAVTPGEGRTLAHIARMGCVRQNVLADRMGVEAMTLSGYLDRLESQGLVTRAADPADRRAKLVRLTEAAEYVLSDVNAVGIALRDEVAHAIPPAEWNAFMSTLKQIRDRLSAIKCDASGKEGRVA